MRASPRLASLTAAERVLLDTPTPDRARRWLAQLTEEPHVAGTPAEKKVADYVLARFKEFGLEAEMSRYDVFLNHPKHVSLKLVAPDEEELKLREEPYNVDKDSTTDGMFPAFHGYGASGTARGQVVYVNYGSPADFERLRGMGISVEGKITLVRYGGAFRGLKVKEAQDRGAVGVLIYSDPADDGYMRGDVYPDGPMRPPSAIQRGSVLFLSHLPGDPSTPDGPSTAGAKRITREQMTNVPKIPSLPISYAEAEKILRRLGGPRVPDEWQGGLPFSYHVGSRRRVGRDGRADGRRPQADLQRHRDDQGQRRAREARSSSATIATPGRTAPSIRTRARRRCSRWRARLARRSRAAGRRSARSSSPAGTPRSTASSARPSGRRSTPANLQKNAVAYSTAMSP